MIKNVSLFATILLTYNISAMLFTPIKQTSRAMPIIAQNLTQHTQSTYPDPANALASHMIKYIDLQRKQQRLQKELSYHEETQGSLEFTENLMIIYSSGTLLVDILHPNTSSPFLATLVAASQTLAISGALYYVYKPLSKTKIHDLEISCNLATAEMNTFKHEVLNPLMSKLQTPASNDPHVQDLLRVAQKIVE